ncbi:MAG: FAD-dependent oxidoreductase [Deltaproteobacteria bacterium]|nr:FAD-dependent oxidoreductase [Deltaproteobacteria bacterium]
MSTIKKKVIDVLVIGDGIAGCVAALAARKRGVDVTIIDKSRSNVPHGNTAFCGGAFRRVSREYPRTKYFADIMKVSEGRADKALTTLTIRNSRRAQANLSRLGIRWTLPSSNPGRADSVVGRGVTLAPALRKAVKKAKIPLLYETNAIGISLSGGSLKSVNVKTKTGTGIIPCKAVVIATGGFQAHRKLVTQHIGKGAHRLVLRGYKRSTGDGHRIAGKLGARLIGMEGYHGGIIHYGYKKYPRVGEVKGMRSVKKYEPGILVNRLGKRFVDEGEDTADKTYAKFGRIIALTQPAGIAYLIFDAKAKEIIDPMYDGPEKGPIEASTIEELAKKLSIPVSRLRRTVDELNRAVDDGTNSKLTPPKSNFAQRIDRPPFYAYAVTGGMTFTFGGIKINSKAEVLGKSTSNIPGLYAAGEVTGGFFYNNYPAGSSLTRCAVFGEIAGKNAADFARRNPS